MLKCPPLKTTIDWEYARRYSWWRWMVRQVHPEKFEKVEEGMRVSWDTEGPGTVTQVVYNPHRKTWYIVVLRGNHQYHFTNPDQLTVVGPRKRSYTNVGV